MKLRRLRLEELQIDDEDAFRGVGLYRDLKDHLVASGYKFAVPEAGAKDAFWSRVLFLNLTFWGGEEADVLMDRRVPADVVAHVAWHALACRELGTSPDAAFLGEAIASAFDLYLVGRLLPVAPDCGFVESQVPALTDAALDAGMSEEDFEAELRRIVDDPERAFEDLRALLFDAATALAGEVPLDEAAARLGALSGRRFYPLLHHYELSNWILHVRARAGGAAAVGVDAKVRGLDAELRAAKDSLDWLEQRWVLAKVAE
jgi:hypothetical protein